MKVIITIPAYNEGETINQVINDIDDKVKDHFPEYTILVVNDGSTDNTVEEAERAGAVVYSHVRNFGLAQTFKTEIKQCLEMGADIIVHTDADGQYDASQIKDLVKEVENGNDLVLASRFAGKIESMPFVKKMGNRMFTKVVSWITKIKFSDCQTGYRAFNRKVAEQIKIESDFTYTQEQLIKCSKENFRIKEVPTTFFKREGKSRLMKNPFDYAWKGGINVLRMFRDYAPLKFFGILGTIFFIPGVIIGSVLFYLFITSGQIYHKIPTAIFCIMMILIGIQIWVLGFLADMKR